MSFRSGDKWRKLLRPRVEFMLTKVKAVFLPRGTGPM